MFTENNVLCRGNNVRPWWGVLYLDMDDSGPAAIFRHRFAKSFDRAETWPADELKTLQGMNPANLDNDDHATERMPLGRLRRADRRGRLLLRRVHGRVYQPAAKAT